MFNTKIVARCVLLLLNLIFRLTVVDLNIIMSYVYAIINLYIQRFVFPALFW